MFLVVYVDDFKLAGSIGSISKGWALIRKGIKLDDPIDMGLDLCYEHKQSEHMVAGVPGSHEKNRWKLAKLWLAQASKLRPSQHRSRRTW